MERANSASVIIPTLNEEKYLPLLLDSLKKIPSPLDIIVVDGNSEDETVQVVEKYRQYFTRDSSLRLIQTKKRSGAFQRNTGALEARHDILIFCDADMIVPSAEAYEKLLIEFVRGNYVAAAPRLVPIESRLDLRLFHWVFFGIQRFLFLFRRPYLPGGYLLTTKAAFEEIGGFDPKVVLAEDVDYSLRAGKLGSCAVFNIPFPVSTRRITKYGYGWMLTQVPNLFRFAFTGKVSPESIFYPFGEFGGEKAHYVTDNRGND